MSWERLRTGLRAGRKDDYFAAQNLPFDIGFGVASFLTVVILFSMVGNYIGNFSHAAWVHQAGTIAGAVAGVAAGIAVMFTIGLRIFGFSAIAAGLLAIAYHVWAK